MVMTLFVIEDI